MENTKITQFVDSLPFFQGFTPKEKRALVETEGIFLKYRPAETIISEGDLDQAMYIILRGAVDIRTSALPNVTISRLQPGSLFGEISLITARARTTDAVAAEDVIVMKIDKKLIETFSPPFQKKFHEKLIEVLIERLDEMNAKFVKAISSAGY